MSYSQNLPLVSVCIPTYNGAAYLEEALSSIKQQTYQNLEVIVSDDGSTDDTLSIVSRFKSEVSYTCHIYNHEPSSIAANWNHAMRHAKGTYIKFLFQDDLLEPECIEKMVNLIESDINMGLVCSKRYVLSEMNNRFTQGWIANFDNLQINLPFNKHNNHIVRGKNLMKAPYFKKKPINIIGEPVAVMFRRSAIDKIGYFDESLFQLVDYEYWLRFFKYYNIGFLSDHLASFRLHQNQASYLNNKNQLNDQHLYYQILFKRYFWFLNSNFKWLLIKKHSSFFKTLRKLKASFNGNT